MSKQNHHDTYGRMLALGLSLTLSISAVPGCLVADEPDGTLGLREAAIEMIQWETRLAETSPEAPVVADAAIIGELQTMTKAFYADGQKTEVAVSLFTADFISVMGVNGQIIQLERVTNGLRVVGAEGNVGIQWTSNFSQLAFHTPQGTFRIDLEGTLVERRQLAALITILGLGGSAKPMAAVAAAAWPVAAIAGLIVVSWGVMCMAYTANCLSQAESICNGNVASVDVGCGGIKMSFEAGEGVPSGGFDIGGFECTILCNPPSGGDSGGSDGPGPGSIPEIPEGFPVPNWEDAMNPCPYGQSPQPCAVTESTMTTDSSGPIEEVTVTSSTSFGYCCMDD